MSKMSNSIRDYLALTKPRLTLLAVVTAMVGFCIGSEGSLHGMLMFNTLLGIAILGAGLAVLNQYMERYPDSLMQRTADRPLPARRLRPGSALLFGVTLAAAGLVQLYVTTDRITATLGAITLIIYLFCYTPLKRATPWCTLIGAVPGALPPVMGFSAASGTLDHRALVLFFLLFFWQLPHFLAIAVMYKEDYRRGAFPMLSVNDRGGKRTARWIAGYTLVLLVTSLWPTYAGIAGLSYLMGAIALGFFFGGIAFDAMVSKTHAAHHRLFLASIAYLPILLAVMMWDAV